MVFLHTRAQRRTKRRHTSYRGPLANGMASVVVDNKSTFLGIVVAVADLVVVVCCVNGRVDDDDLVRMEEGAAECIHPPIIDNCENPKTRGDDDNVGITIDTANNDFIIILFIIMIRIRRCGGFKVQVDVSLNNVIQETSFEIEELGGKLVWLCVGG